jgi:hypothetical protein
MYQVMTRGYSDLNHSTIFRRLSPNIAVMAAPMQPRHNGHGGQRGSNVGEDIGWWCESNSVLAVDMVSPSSKPHKLISRANKLCTI